MDFCELIDAHIESHADITIAAQPVDAGRRDARWASSASTTRGQIVGFEEKPDAARLAEMESSAPRGATVGGLTADKPFVASMGIYVFSRDVLLDMLEQPGIDFGKEIIPAALGTLQRERRTSIRGYWADVGTIDAFYDANIQLTQRGAPFNFFHPRRPIYTHPRFLPATRALRLPHRRVDRRRRLLPRSAARSATRSSASARTSARGARITRSVLLGADFYEEEGRRRRSPLGIGRDVVLDRVIVDKNARIADGVRLVNEAGVEDADGDGYYIRNGIIIVPKGARREIRRDGRERPSRLDPVAPPITRPATRPRRRHRFITSPAAGPQHRPPVHP